jgi:hypothetical protein
VTQAETRLLTSAIACVFFGYAAINSLVFYRRTRRQVDEYRDRPMERLVRSRQYDWAIWTTGIIGVIGFAVASWRLVLTTLAILHG